MSRSLLRNAVAMVGGLFLLGALVVAVLVAPPAGIPLAFWGAVILLGLAFERWRYKRVQPAAEPGFQRTAERFVDPSSGRPVTVYADPRTGERRYVDG